MGDTNFKMILQGLKGLNRIQAFTYQNDVLDNESTT